MPRNGIEDYIPSQNSGAYTVWEIGKTFETSPHLCTTHAAVPQGMGDRWRVNYKQTKRTTHKSSHC